MSTESEIWQLLEEVKDPEVPVLSILDLGIVRSVKTTDHKIEIVITPTYSGCPAMDVIAMDIRLKLIEKGYRNVSITSMPNHWLNKSAFIICTTTCSAKLSFSAWLILL